MKQSTIGVVIAVLIGMAFFGFYKSLVLWKKNLTLKHSVEDLNVKLAATQLSLKETKKHLSESYLENAKLDVEHRMLESKAAEQEQKIHAYLRNLAVLSQQLKDTQQTNEFLSTRNKETEDRFVRLELENKEMKEKLSSIQGLKKAIRELKVKMREERHTKQPIQNRGAVEPKIKPAVLQLLQTPQQRDRRDAVLRGNLGYLMKDGKSTFLEFVDIQVLSVEPNVP